MRCLLLGRNRRLARDVSPQYLSVVTNHPALLLKGGPCPYASGAEECANVMQSPWGEASGWGGVERGGLVVKLPDEWKSHSSWDEDGRHLYC